MKTFLLKPLTLLLLALCTAATSALAYASQGPHGDGHRPGNPEARAYVLQQVMPVLRQQRQKLEPQLAAADQAQLATYRTQLRELHQRRKALRQSFRPADAPAGTRPALTEPQREQLQQLRTETQTVLGNVKQLAQKYEASIRQLTAEIQPQRDKWTTDLQALMAKNTESKPNDPNGQLNRQGHGHGGLARFLRPTAFLLLDPNAPAAPSPAASPNGASSYPNPATAASQLSYDVTKAGPVTIELLDGRGNALRTVAQEAKQDKGRHTVAVDVADLPRGTYFYKITTRAGTETQRFVKE